MSESGGGRTSPGWYTDPAGRFEYRYHNGAVWTSDVASNGQRYVDPLASTVPHRASVGLVDHRAVAGKRTGNGIAIAAMVCGIVSVVVGWGPYVFWAGAVLAVLALIFGLVGLRRARETGRRKGFAIAGVVTGAVGIPIAAVGLLFTVAVHRAIDRYEHPPESTSSIESCEVEAGRARAEGELRNDGTRASRFTVYVEFRALPAGHTIERAATLPSTAPGGTARFAVSQRLAAESVECEITAVQGPFPFGLELD
ncbi:MAG TPA: DUF2510 domain-containing protein [Ilumatobacteraceae bacterium]|nr:DUF2510 domain-containing protein [Ilumatobacteraceae bacterium]